MHAYMKCCSAMQTLPCRARLACLERTPCPRHAGCGLCPSAPWVSTAVKDMQLTGSVVITNPCYNKPSLGGDAVFAPGSGRSRFTHFAFTGRLNMPLPWACATAASAVLSSMLEGKLCRPLGSLNEAVLAPFEARPQQLVLALHPPGRGTGRAARWHGTSRQRTSCQKNT